MTAGIRSIRNQYRGINAHLHSYWQAMGGWSSFHGNHIADLLRALRAALRPMGYTADLESSLQVRRLDQPIDEPESAVTIFDPHPIRPFLPPQRVAPIPKCWSSRCRKFCKNRPSANMNSEPLQFTNLSTVVATKGASGLA